MRLLITGADGFTGRHLSITARALGYEVIFLASDLTDSSAVMQEILNVDPNYVIHLAAISAVTHSDENAFYKVNLFGTINLLDALIALSVKPKKIILASSANVYGNVDSCSIHEDIVPKPINHYAISKLAMEHISRTYLEELPIVITRPFNYTGKGHDERFLIPKIVRHYIQKSRQIELGNINVLREYNDVRVICDAYLKLLKLGVVGEIYNVCSGKMYSIDEIISSLNRLTSHDMKVKINPEFIRKNEVFKLAGSIEKLEATIGCINHPNLEDTLSWMLSANGLSKN